MCKFVVSTCAETAKLAVKLGKGHDTFEDALDVRNSLPRKSHNKYGIFLVYNDTSRLATAQ